MVSLSRWLVVRIPFGALASRVSEVHGNAGRPCARHAIPGLDTSAQALCGVVESVSDRLGLLGVEHVVHDSHVSHRAAQSDGGFQFLVAYALGGIGDRVFGDFHVFRNAIQVNSARIGPADRVAENPDIRHLTRGVLQPAIGENGEVKSHAGTPRRPALRVDVGDGVVGDPHVLDLHRRRRPSIRNDADTVEFGIALLPPGNINGDVVPLEDQVVEFTVFDAPDGEAAPDVDQFVFDVVLVDRGFRGLTVPAGADVDPVSETGDEVVRELVVAAVDLDGGPRRMCRHRSGWS